MPNNTYKIPKPKKKPEQAMGKQRSRKSIETETMVPSFFKETIDHRKKKK